MSKMPSLLTSTFFAQGATPAAPQQSGGIPGVMIIGYLLLFAAMYFFMIAPQRKKQKAHEKMLASLQTGDEVVTTGGIFGVITNVKDDRFVVRIAENTKIEVGKAFVQTVLTRKTEAEKIEKK